MAGIKYQLYQPKGTNMLKWTITLLPKVAKGLATTIVYKYAKDRAVWYYHNAVNPKYSETMLNLYRVNKMEREINRPSYGGIEKRVFNISREGDVYDVKTGAVYGNVTEPVRNKYEHDRQFHDAINEEKAVTS
jgi:hypothetical protein